jgi:hypothetical protein
MLPLLRVCPNAIPAKRRNAVMIISFFIVESFEGFWLLVRRISRVSCLDLTFSDKDN